MADQQHGQGVRLVLDATLDREPVNDAQLDRVVFIEGHTKTGQPVIELVVKTEDGKLHGAIVTMAIFEMIERAMVARADHLGYRIDGLTGYRTKPNGRS